jgi:hypothetical protein
VYGESCEAQIGLADQTHCSGTVKTKSSQQNKTVKPVTPIPNFENTGTKTTTKKGRQRALNTNSKPKQRDSKKGRKK